MVVVFLFIESINVAGVMVCPNDITRNSIFLSRGKRGNFFETKLRYSFTIAMHPFGGSLYGYSGLTINLFLK